MEEEIQQYLRFHPLSSRSELMEGVNTKVSVATFKRLLAAMISSEREAQGRFPKGKDLPPVIN